MYKRYIKRFLDFSLSLLAVIFLSPLLLITAMVVRVNLGSPVIFKQQRPGKDGKIFSLYKFRTMRDATELSTGRKITDKERLSLIEKEGKNSVSTDAERLTKVGKALRALSLDELPELFNILEGKMSIVGPRPLATIYLPYYNEHEKHRHDVLPGLTGLAQVNGRNAISWEKRFDYDIEYVNHVTFSNDLRIILKTVAVVFNHSDIAQGEERPEAFNVIRERQLEKESNIDNLL